MFMKRIPTFPRRVICVLIGCMFLLAACTPFVHSPVDGQGTISIMGSLQTPSAVELVEARLIVTRGKHTFEETVPIHNDQFAATLNIPIGTWDLTVLLIDEEGIVRFQNSNQSIEVQPHKPSTIELSMGPADCLVTIEIQLENYAFKKVTNRARVFFDDTMYELIREDFTEPLVGEFKISPGSYDFKVELYTESFRIGDRIAPGIWELLEIPIAQELHLTWNPLTEIIKVTGTVHIPASAPTNVTVQQTLSRITISWEPPQDPYVTGYFVFVQTNPLERFKLINPTPVTEPTLTHFIEELELEASISEVRYTVAAVSSNGNVGFRSEETILQLETVPK